MTIIPIFRGEMTAAARQGKLQSERRGFVTALFLMIGGSFAAWYYWMEGALTSWTMARVADEALRWSVGFHGGLIGIILMRGARAIAKERDRRTLDFVLVTRLNSAEIVLGKLASCLAVTFGILAAGLPVMLLLHVLAGVESRLIWLAYIAFGSVILFLSAWAIWVSIEVPDGRTAAGLFALCTMAWLIGPFSLSVFLPRAGIRLPQWVAAVNWCLVASSPVSIAFHIATGLHSWSQLVYFVGRMIALQLAGTALFTIAAIVRLRPAHLAIGGIDRQARRRERRRLVWRFRARPPVGDDPILWREMYTSRETSVAKAANLLIWGGLAIGLAAATFYYAKPAFVELWQHGYVAATGTPDHEMNILVRMFVPQTGSGRPVDLARIDFNLFIRYATIAIVVMMVFIIGAMASEVLGVERLKETWTSLLATPLEPRDLVRSAILAAFWRSRGAYGAVLILWTLGLVAGAIHPLGFVISLLELAASAWLMAAYGVLGSIQAQKGEVSTGQGALLALILTGTGVLPLLLPAGLNSALWGAGSLPLMVWTSLVSYRDVAAVIATPLATNLSWVGLSGGQMPLLVFASWIIAIVGPALGGLWIRRYTLNHFDRLVGRPYRAAEAPELDVATPSPAPSVTRSAVGLARRGSPLAEADGAVIG